MAKAAENGQSEAHTRADPLDLAAGLPDIEATDLLAVCADLVAAPRRAKGRPEGAPNRKNNDMIAYLTALGHRDPWVTLSMVQTADTAKLAQQLGMKRGEALALQVRAADAIMPYHHGKKPTQVELDLGRNQRPFMVLGDMNVAIIGENGFMSAGEPPMKTIDNQPLSEAATVRPDGDESHDDAK